MSTQVQYRRGTSAQNDAFTGALAEITVDTTNKVLRVHDGITAGGFSLAGLAATQTLTNKTLSSVTITGTVTGNIIPSANITYNLGNTTNRFNDLWLANSTIYLGSAQISANATSLILTNPGGGTTVLAGASAQITATSISASGNVTGGNILTSGIVSATGNITGNFIFGNGSQLTGIDATSIQSGTSNVRVVSSGGNVAAGIGGTSNVLVIASTGTFVTGVESVTGNITGANINTAGLVTATGNVTGGNLLTAGLISATGNVSGGNLNVTGNIVDTGALAILTGSNGNLTLNAGTGFIIASSGILNGQANGTGNIGNSTGYFNTVFAKATSAQYADVAEKYVADRSYSPGTVLEIGGAAEVQETTSYASTKIAGVVSTAPALIMNSTESDANAVELALLGRVPCRVTGKINRGDLLTSSSVSGVATALAAQDYQPGCVIGKALEGHTGEAEGMIEVLVGRL